MIIGTLPFYANYSFKANDLTSIIEILVSNLKAVLTAYEIREIYANLRLELTFCY